MLIVLEGINGAGKSTLADILADSIEGRVKKFPTYNSDVGEILTAWRNVRITNKAVAAHLQLLQTADKLMFLEGLLRARGNPNEHLILDRYWQSSWVYGQPLVPAAYLERINSLLPKADMNILLRRDPVEAVKVCRARAVNHTLIETLVTETGVKAANYNHLWIRNASNPTYKSITVEHDIADTYIQAMEILNAMPTV